MSNEVAIFAAGCFWGVEAEFRQIKGVRATSVGYTGGNRVAPSYEDVCTGKTGHAEAVRVEYDPDRVSYEDLLEVFWANHDPTQINRQGPDVGAQYRTGIFFTTPDQQAAAEKSKRMLEESGRFKRAIATEIFAAEEFFPAEDYHQQYLEKRGLGHREGTHREGTDN